MINAQNMFKTNVGFDGWSKLTTAFYLMIVIVLCINAGCRESICQNKLEMWASNWINGDKNLRKTSLEWFYNNYIKIGMNKHDIEPVAQLIFRAVDAGRRDFSSVAPARCATV